ncbi:MAG: hypothetical protein ACYSUM_22615 [Planctomycetota bacterium]|jgi:hypothetical protein
MRIAALLLLTAVVVLAVDLPRDPKAVVLSYDEVGGYGPARTRKEPYVAVLADGTVKVPPFREGAKDLEVKLGAAELQELMRFVVEKHRFFEFDEKKVKAAMGQGNVIIMDASAAVISVRVRGKSKQARVYALTYAARQHRKVRALQDLSAIQQRLVNLMAIVRAGGKTKAAALLTLANAELRKSHPKVKPLTAGDLVSTSKYPDESVVLRFHRYEGPGRYTSASVRQPKDGDPQVEVSAKEK